MTATSKPPPQARDFMTKRVHTISADASLEEVISFLDQHEISNAPVVEQDESGHPILIGFISEGDCLEHLSNEVFFGSPFQSQTARSIMKRHPVCVDPSTDIFTLASILVNHRYRHIPVVENGQLLGIVSRRDILQALDKYYRDDQAGRALEKHPRDLREVINLRFIGKEK